MNSLSNDNKPKQQIRGSFFENLKDLGSSTGKTAVSEAGKIGSGVVGGVFGGPQWSVPSWENQGLQRPFSPESLRARKEAPTSVKPRETEVFSFAERQDRLEAKQEIIRLVSEIKKAILALEKKQKIMISEVAKVTVEVLPENPGPYHVRFFEWLLRILRDLRKKVSESATWLSVLRSKKKQRNYWKMYKKHGTGFGLSAERAVATQAG